MITKKSPLFLERFDILNSKCDLIPSGDASLNLMEATKDMPVDIDFAIKKNDDDLFFIFVKVEINNTDNPQPGYSILAEGIGAFGLQEGLTDNEKQQYISSGVNICITNLRSYVNTVTSFYPLGRFSFHSIDMPALFKSKGESKKEEK